MNLVKILAIEVVFGFVVFVLTFVFVLFVVALDRGARGPVAHAILVPVLIAARFSSQVVAALLKLKQLNNMDMTKNLPLQMSFLVYFSRIFE